MKSLFLPFSISSYYLLFIVFSLPFYSSFLSLAKSKGRYGGSVNAVAISPSFTHFAAARNNYLCVGPIDLAQMAGNEAFNLQESRLYHTAKITAIDFSPDSKQLLSAGLDCQVFVWDVEDPEKFEKMVSIHAPLGVTQAKWLKQGTFLTSGPDAIVRAWTK